MNDRERWIVYPLLFLALGAALRDKIAKQTRAKQIACETLYLVDSEGRTMAYLTGNELRFDQGGAGNGFVVANAMDAQAFTQRGQRLAPAGAAGGGSGTVKLPLQDLLRMLPQFRLPQNTNPPNPQNQPKQPPAAGEVPKSQPVPPGAGPTLQPPAGPEPEPSGDA